VTEAKVIQAKVIQAKITAPTLAHYEATAQSFWEGTRDHDVSQNYAAFLDAMNAGASGAFDILDFGCGPGRDVQYFAERGHRPVGLDGTLAFVEMARQHTGREVLHQDFVALDLPPARFDGVFANASLFHVPREVLPSVLTALAATLRPRGILFSSNPRGPELERVSAEGRYGYYVELPAWRTYMQAAGFEELSHYYRPPGRPREEQPWLASVWRKLG
jgi:SAM-dependent methyltransferase